MRNIFSYLPKKTLVVAFGVVMALSAATIALAVTAWGPDRPIKHWLGDGTAGFDHVTLNSFVDVPYNIGDERDFTRGKIVGEGSTMLDPVNGVEDGDVLYISMWVHNGADPSLNASGAGIAENLTARVNIPSSEGTTHEITGYLNADNAVPAGPYWDKVIINTTANTVLEFVPGSATIKTNYLDYAALGDQIASSGVLIGDNALDGEMPGCFDYGAWVNFRVRVVEVKEPVFRCDALTVTPIDRTNFRFVANATAQNGAAITKYVFNFGDGDTAQVVTDAVSAHVNHRYEAAGTYDSKVTVNFRIDGRNVTRDCVSRVVVEREPVTPTYRCNSLDIVKLATARSIRVTVNASGEPADQVRITGYSYNFGDGPAVSSASNTQEHTYGSDGTKNVAVTVSFNVNGETKTATCQGSVIFTPPTLPNTGPASILGALFGTSTLGVALRGLVKSRRELRSTLLNG